MKRSTIDLTLVAIVLFAVGLSVGVSVIPTWIRYSIQIAIAAALASVGVLILLRGGLLSFGQGLFYFVGAYSVALLNRSLGVTDALLMVVAAAASAALVAAIMGIFIARYRGIFFSMLTLALSMVIYGIAVKIRLFGGTDGLNVGQLSFAGYRPRGADLQLATYLLCVWTGALFAVAAHFFLRSRLGKIIEGIDQNEVRIEYLGRSVTTTIQMAYIAAGTMAGVGGALAGLSARHVDPGFAYWTTAGDFVFIVLLGGMASVLSPFLGSGFLEIVRTLSASYFPDEWQLVQGAIMLLIVLFLPTGLGYPFIIALRYVKRAAVSPLQLDELAEKRTRP
jgi:ABC-type branched-subunit amino acid transport system permease subunit